MIWSRDAGLRTMPGRGSSSDFAAADTRSKSRARPAALARRDGRPYDWVRCGWTASGGVAAQGAQAGPVIAGAELLLQPA
jgi:hypothetical protein